MIKSVVFSGVGGVKHFSAKRATAIVSILDYSERSERPDLTEFCAVLMLEFEDVSDGSPVLMGKVLPDDPNVGDDRCPYNPVERFCTLQDARKVLEFLARINQDPRVSTLYVHCMAGVSRSAALVQFVLDVSKGKVANDSEGVRSLAGMNKRFHRLLHLAFQQSGLVLF